MSRVTTANAFQLANPHTQEAMTKTNQATASSADFPSLQDIYNFVLSESELFLSPDLPPNPQKKSLSPAPQNKIDEITVMAEPSQTFNIAQYAGPIGQGATTTPAIDPYNGAIDLQHLQQAVSQMRKALPALPANPSAKAQTLHAEIGQHLGAIEKFALANERSAAALDASNPGMSGSQLAMQLPLDERVHLGYSVRDHFAQAAQAARKLSRTFPKGSTQREVFKTLAGVLGSLKRIHLTAVAPDHKELYTQQEMANLEKAVPGMTQGRSGATLLTSTTVTGGGAPLLNLQAAGVGNAMYLVDDEMDVIHPSGGSVNAAFKPGVSKVATLGVRAGVVAATNFYVGLKPDTVIKNKLIDKANDSHVLGRSAGPNARKIATGTHQAWNNAKYFAGRSYVPANGIPKHLSDDKMAKGATTTALHLLAQKLDTQVGNTKAPVVGEAPPSWDTIVKAFYPSVPQLAAQQLATGGQLPAATAWDRATPVALAQSNRKVALINPFVQGEATLIHDNPEPDVPLGYNANFITKYDKLNTNVRSPRMAHELMDTARMKDAQQVFNLVADYDAVLRILKAQDRPIPPRMTQYSAVTEAFGGLDGDPTYGALPKDAFWGANVPLQMESSIASPSVQKVKTAEAECKRLAALGSALAIEGETLMDKPDAHMKTVRAELDAARQQAFRTINENIWGATYATDGSVTGGFPGGMRKALAKPEKFLAQSHDALSSALGLTGVHLFVNKRQLAVAKQEGARDAIVAADTAYTRTRELLDKTFLAIRKDNIVRDHGSVNSSLFFNREQATTSASITFGGALNETWDRLQAGHVFNHEAHWQNTTIKIAANLQIQTRLANRQVFDSRLGFYAEGTLTLESGVPFTGEMLNMAVMATLKKAGLGGSEAKLQIGDVEEMLTQAVGLFEPRTSGLTLNLMWRQPPKSDARSMELEYIRLSKSTTGGLNVDIGPSVPATGVIAKTVVAEVRRSPQVEVMGPGIGYLVAQNPKLTEDLKNVREALDAHRAGKGQGPASFKEVAKAMFLGDAEAGIPANDYQRTRYFGKGDMIVKVLEKWLDVRHAQTTGTMPAPGEALPNELFRYFTQEPFKRIRTVAKEAEHHAPGASASGKDPFAVPKSLKTLNGLQLVTPATPGTPAAVHYDKHSPEWARYKTEIGQLKTPEDRVRYFSDTTRTEEFLENFVTLISNLEASVMVHHAEKDREVRPAGFGASVLPKRLMA